MSAPSGFSPFGFKPSSAPDPTDVEAQRRLARRARAAGRQWILRGILFVVIAVIGLVRGGSLMIAIGVVCWILALLSISLGYQTRRQAIAVDEKLSLMKRGGAGGGEAGRVEGGDSRGDRGQ